VGRHLKILLDAGLLERRRAGRSVLYYRTAVAESLVAAQPDPHARRQDIRRTGNTARSE